MYATILKRCNILHCHTALEDLWLTKRFLSSLPEVTKSNEHTPAEKKEGYYEKERSSLLSVFSSDTSQFLQLHKYNPMKFTLSRFRRWKRNTSREISLLRQEFIPTRHNTLGYDLAAAHFIVFRGAKVKFVGHNDWIYKEPNSKTNPSQLPTKIVGGWYLEAIDCSNCEIMYEGLSNLVNLQKLRWLSLKACPNVDNWFVDRISNEYQNSLEYLDLSDCKGVDEGALSCIYRMKKLKTLKLENIVQTPSFKLACLDLEEITGLNVEGVEYSINAAEEVKN